MKRKHYSAIFMCAMTIAMAVPTVPAFAAPGNVSMVIAAKGKTNASSGKNMEDVAKDVQLAFENKDMDKLAKLCSYPLSIVYSDGTLAEIKNKEALQELGKDVIFSSKMQDAIASTNVAKLKEVGKAGVQMGGSNGLNLYKFKRKWKVTSIYLDAASGTATPDLRISDMKEAAITIQKTFSYKDLETLSRMCNYPLTLVEANGTMKEIKNSQELMALGENKVFTDKLRKAIDKTDADKLEDGGDAGVMIGGDSGLSMFSFDGAWKINNIYQ